jgi:hypothetical protein
MPKKIQNTSRATLLNVALPNHGASYTVISHQFVIDYSQQALANAGFNIVEEEYRCTADGQIAQGIYKLDFNNDPELSMMFAWTNSYNKQVKFKCVIGGYINKTGSVMISGDMGSWVRKHMGSADTEIKDTIDNYITNAHMYYNQLVSDKATMEGIILNKRRQSQLLGVLFAEYEVLTTEQASMIRDQMKKPNHVFTSTDSLWAFYNYVTVALQHSHPKTWMEDQRVMHYFISSINNFPICSAPAQIVVPVPTDITSDTPLVDPNQVDLEDLIAQVEAEEAMSETIVTYTDLAGNTFEAIDFHNEVVSDTNQLEDPKDEEEDLNDWMNLPLESDNKDEAPTYIPDENQEYTGENASHMKGSDFDVDKDDFSFDPSDDNSSTDDLTVDFDF